jgi:hypothetical protein
METVHDIRRYISYFDNKTDKLIGEFELCHFDLGKFQRHYSINNNMNLMFDSYPVTKRDTGFITSFLSEDVLWDFKKYSYFLDAESG